MSHHLTNNPVFIYSPTICLHAIYRLSSDDQALLYVLKPRPVLKLLFDCGLVHLYILFAVIISSLSYSFLQSCPTRSLLACPPSLLKLLILIFASSLRAALLVQQPFFARSEAPAQVCRVQPPFGLRVKLLRKQAGPKTRPIERAATPRVRRQAKSGGAPTGHKTERISTLEPKSSRIPSRRALLARPYTTAISRPRLLTVRRAT